MSWHFIFIDSANFQTPLRTDTLVEPVVLLTHKGPHTAGVFHVFNYSTNHLYRTNIKLRHDNILNEKICSSGKASAEVICSNFLLVYFVVFSVTPHPSITSR